MHRLLLLLAGAHAHDYFLDGSGTTNPSKFYWEIMSRFEAQAKPAVKMTYRAVGSSTGQCEFMGVCGDTVSDGGAFNDFGSGDMPFTEDDRQTLVNAGATFAHVPFSLGAMSFFHNVPDSTLPTTGLNMEACVLADIFMGVITTWDHADIKAINPSFSPPAGQAITVFHRTYGSSTTKGITQYLHAACPAKWIADLVGSTIAWPASTSAVEGSGEMSSSISATEYSIGYIDSGHGHDDGLSEIELKNLHGTFQSSTQAKANNGVQEAAAQAISTGVMPSDPLADFSTVSLHNMPGEFTWPIVAISYLYVRVDQTGTAEKGPLLKAFVRYVLSEEGQALLADYNFEGVPASVLALSNEAIAAMQLDATPLPEWTFETDTDKGNGQKDFVISAKRRSHYEYAIGEIMDEMATNVMLADAVTTLEAKIVAADDHDDDHHHETDPLAVAALVLALVGALLAALALFKVTQLENAGVVATRAKTAEMI